MTTEDLAVLEQHPAVSFSSTGSWLDTERGGDES